MKIPPGLICVVAVCLLCGCAGRGGPGSSLTIDFDGMTIAGIKPGAPEETVIERIGYPYEVRYGRADRPKELWPYYDLGLKVVINKESREVEGLVAFFNRYQAYRPFRGSIVQGVPLASRVVQVKPVLEGYTEVKTDRRGYEEVQVYSDNVVTSWEEKEMVSLEKVDGAVMTVYFDYDDWMERVTLEREEAETAELPQVREEVVVEEPVAEEGKEERAIDLKVGPKP